MLFEVYFLLWQIRQVILREKILMRFYKTPHNKMTSPYQSNQYSATGQLILILRYKPASAECKQQHETCTYLFKGIHMNNTVLDL